jgi:hypothetical protein
VSKVVGNVGTEEKFFDLHRETLEIEANYSAIDLYVVVRQLTCCMKSAKFLPI